MKETTVKLSGHPKDRFLDRFFAEEPDLSADLARRLATRTKAAFTSLRVRKAVVSAVSRRHHSGAQSLPASLPRAAVSPAAADPVQSAAPTAEFDPYVIGLVPVFQREGREGLIAKLGGIGQLDQLRQMAKAQQIVLPQELRAGDAALDTVRAAIADAVAKRIADRRAAAG